MADTETKAKAKKLPPLSPKSGDTEGKKPVRKRKKKPTEDTANGEVTTKPEGTPRKKKAPAKLTEGDPQSSETTTTPRKRKKKKPVAKTEGEGADPASARSAVSQGEDVTGSKTSLIKGTPKKKVKKKVKKTATTTPRGDDEFMDATLAADLTAIQDDIVAPEEKKDKEDFHQPYSTGSAILKSQPLEKLFVETDRGFKGEDKSKLAKKWAEEEAIKAEEPEAPKNTTIEFALSCHRVFGTFCLFIHGLTAGIAMWQIAITYVLRYKDNIDFIDHYRPLALPVQSMFYILLVLCAVSACDRFDISNPTRRFIHQSFTLQTGTVSIIIYIVALVLSLCIANLEDKIYLYDKYADLWTDAGITEENLSTWTNMNTARGVAAILGWVVLSITSNTDRMAENLREGEDNILGESLELNTSPA
ncbi:hypothetical protein KUTeg_004671 [Tegillarca granosa]|uniref:Uncharacterized protein n=1 Tax=Tegillarca granosa TaxID=220873 RepID=A0ABQ9FMB0_TEGGR|nr:hypothetical protein KUTeg_004671 [Tegillarca granosa]